jgi:predicted cupin superfamily sugar epimerase
MSHLTADDVIRVLNLAPHPEGGHYRETFRDAAHVANGRAASTAIYFLLRAGERSHWHRVDAAEVWHYHAGAPLQLLVANQKETITFTLGSDLLANERPQVIVPAGAWQAAECKGAEPSAWTLVSCTVAPGFQFSGFELAPPHWSPSEYPK